MAALPHGARQAEKNSLFGQMLWLAYDDGCGRCLFAKGEIERVRLGQLDFDVRVFPCQSEELAAILEVSYRSSRPDLAILI